MANKQVFFTFALLLLVLSSTKARPTPSNLIPKPVPQEAEDWSKDEDGCGGLESDECLIRRSMVAHIDYIYTQDQNEDYGLELHWPWATGDNSKPKGVDKKIPSSMYFSDGDQADAGITWEKDGLVAGVAAVCWNWKGEVLEVLTRHQLCTPLIAEAHPC